MTFQFNFAGEQLSLRSTIPESESSPLDKTLQPATSVPAAPGRQQENLILSLACILYAVVFLVFWPRSFATMDESTYINMAYVLRQGTVYPDVAGMSVVSTYPVQGHMVSKYPLGMPALLAGVSLLGEPAVFAVNCVVHLLIFYLLIRLFRQLGVPAIFALLYLLHPTAVIFSRTLMADPVSGLLLTLAFYAYVNRRFTICGVAVGLSVLMRTANAIALFIFILGCLVELSDKEQRVDRKMQAASIFSLGIGATPAIAAALYYAAIIAGGKMASHTGTFALAYFPQMFPGYMIGLLLIYPGMLVAPALYRGPNRLVLNLLCYSFILLYSFWYYRDQGSSALETLIVGQRYFLAILPLFIVAYSTLIWNLIKLWPQRTKIAVGAVVMVICWCLDVGIHARHAQYTAKLAQVRESVLQTVTAKDTLFCNTTLGKLMYPGHTIPQVGLLGGQATTENLALSTATVREALKHPHKRVFLAYWIRPNRADDAKEAELLSRVSGNFETLPLTKEQQSHLPPEVHMVQIVKERLLPVRGT